ncbi:hypothetical protein GL263_25295 [Streptomyces durbertensis]|uniref:DUF7848 domain-containing protein n=1 Tax=Streptomyces durbertensis TaxID=2448886 RepID=A0ABR6EPK4_9ACTN|nr:hypothetical protein [Streptomyces durbertensis]MBB1246840.1 hypothetical protein [Streptomyces durbertensis]
MVRATYRFREYGIGPDREPDAEPMTFAMRCAVCGQRGPTCERPEESAAWITAHLREHPHHLSYRETVRRSYRAVPGEWR